MSISRSHILIGIFFLVSLVGVFHHELSLDEARPWIIVQETPATKLMSETRCEMHCLPWFYSLKAISGIVSNPVAMQVFGVILGTIAFGLMALFSPFSLVEKSLLLLNYYILFEFNLIARPYTLMTLGIFLVCTTFMKREAYPLRFVGSILLLAHSTYFGILLTFPFVGLYAYELVSKKIATDKKNLFGIILISAVYAGSVIWYSIPLTSSYKCVDLSMKNVSLDFARFSEATWDITRAFLILGNETWNEHVLDYSESGRNILSTIWVFAVFAIAYGIRKSPRALFLFVSSVFLLFMYRLTKPMYYGSFLRHLGAMSVMYVGCMWIAIRENPKQSLAPRILFHVFLLSGAYSGAKLYTEDYSRPFSNGKAVHDFISRSENAALKIVPDSILFTSSYLVYSDRTFTDYLSPLQVESRFYPVSVSIKPTYVEAAHIRGRHIVPKVRGDILRKAIEEVGKVSNSALVIISYPAKPGVMESMGLKNVDSMTGAINPNEDYYIYRKVE